jgi:D-3-phosphoglycerate dehydrogenase
MSHRVYITGPGIAPVAQRHLETNGCVVQDGNQRDSHVELLERVKRFRPDAIIVRTGLLSADVMDAAPALRIVCKHGVGVDNIDVGAATARGIPVMYTPDTNYASVAEHTVALLLALLRRVPALDRRVRDGVFEKAGYDGAELGTKTVGIVGFGRVGRRVAALLAPFGAGLLVHDPEAALETPPSVVRVERLEDLLAAVDVVTLHCPLTDETRGLIDAAAIARMRPGVYLVNTSRGGVVREDDLLEALQSGRVAGAALDVFEREPPDLDAPLFALENVIATPHVAGVSDATLPAMGMAAARHVLAALNGEELESRAVLNPEVLAGR